MAKYLQLNINQKAIFPDFGIKNIRVYYIYFFLLNSWFAMGNWFFYWLKFMTKFEIGLFDAIGFGIALLLEVPSGAIADLLGKRNTLILASIMRVIGIAMMAFGDTKYLLLIGNIFYVGGYSFHSGAAEALAYDSLVEKKKESFYEKVASSSHLLGVIFTIIAAVIGGILYSVNDRLPWIAWFVACVVSLFVTFLFTEPKVDTLKFTFKNYFSQLGKGFKVLFSKSLKQYFILFFLISGIFYMYEWGFIRMAIGELIGFNGVSQSFASALVTFASIIAVLLLPRIRRLVSDKEGMLILILIMGIGFLGVSFEVNLFFGLLFINFISITGNLSTPWISIIVNKEVESNIRATAISSLAFFTKLPYVLISVVAGIILENGQFPLFLLIICIILFLGATTSGLIFRSSSKFHSS